MAFSEGSPISAICMPIWPNTTSHWLKRIFENYPDTAFHRKKRSIQYFWYADSLWPQLVKADGQILSFSYIRVIWRHRSIMVISMVLTLVKNKDITVHLVRVFRPLVRFQNRQIDTVPTANPLIGIILCVLILQIGRVVAMKMMVQQ